MKELVLLGIDFARAPLEVREQLAFSADQARQLYGEAGVQPDGEVMLISTCNRTEFLIASPEPERAEQSLLAYLRRLRPSARALDDACCRYRLTGDAVVKHLMAVASGLRSQVIGDAHIARQVRDSAQLAASCRASGKELGRVVQASLRAARRVRRETGIGNGAASVGAAVVGGIRRGFGGTAQLQILIAGSGQAATDAATHLAKLRPAGIVFVTRDAQAGVRLASAFGGRSAEWGELAREVARADVAVLAVSAPEPVLTGAGLALVRSEAGSGSRKLLIVDLGVPRTASSDCGVLPGVSLLNIDEVQTELAATQAARKLALPLADAVIEGEWACYRRRHRRSLLEPAIRRCYEQAARIRDRTVEDASRKNRGDARELSRLLTQRLLDGPVRRLRYLAALDQRAAEAAAWVLAASDRGRSVLEWQSETD